MLTLRFHSCSRRLASSKMQSPSFISSVPLSSPHRHCHKLFLLPLCPPSKNTPRMSGKGFGKRGSKPDQGIQRKSDNLEQPGIDSAYTPRGPTMREEYERRGVIAPEGGPNAGVLPEVVADRMLRRILTFGAVPLSLLFVFFAVYFFLKYKYDITVIPVVVAYSTLGTVGMATLGITYGIFSSSWDEDIEGTALGWQEAKKNFVRAKNGLFGAREKEKQEEEFARIDQKLDNEKE